MKRKSNFNRLSVRQKAFCRYVAEGFNPSQAALKSGYSEKGNRSRACRLMKRADVKKEIIKIQEEERSSRITTLQERKALISDIIRATTNSAGIIGKWKEINESESLDGVVEIKNVTVTDKRGNTKSTTLVKLINPLTAIHILNKMEGLYKHPPKINTQIPRLEPKILVKIGKYGKPQDIKSLLRK